VGEAVLWVVMASPFLLCIEKRTQVLRDRWRQFISLSDRPKEEGDSMKIAQLILEFIKAFIWPAVTITIVLIFREQLRGIVRHLKKADLPGVSLEFDKEVQEAKQLSQEIKALPLPEKAKNIPSIPLTEANARLLSLDLQPSPSGLDMSYYRELARQDPNIALAGLRIEIDILARNLAKGFKVEVAPRDSGSRLFQRLHDEHAITPEQLRFVLKIWRLCTAAVHGQRVSRRRAEDLLDAADVLADQYIAWLSWGFDDDWEPKPND